MIIPVFVSPRNCFPSVSIMATEAPAPREVSMGWSSRADADSPGRVSMNDFSNRNSSHCAGNVSRGDSLAYSEDSGAINLLGGGMVKTQANTPYLRPCCKKTTTGPINDSMASEDSLRDVHKNACCVIQ